MAELFVSYCRDDSGVIEPIVENLRRLGFDLWIDIEHLKPGTPQWTQAVDDALHRADGVLAFLSPSAKKSHWCNIETMRAQTFGKPIYPVLLSGDGRTAVPIHLEGIQYTDLRGRADRERQFDQLAQTLATDLGLSLPDYELGADRSDQPEIHIHVSGHVEGNIYALNVGGDVDGQVNIAGGDIVHQHPAAPAAVQPAPARERPYARSSAPPTQPMSPPWFQPDPQEKPKATKKRPWPLIIGGAGLAGIVIVIGGFFTIRALINGSSPDISQTQPPAIRPTTPAGGPSPFPTNTPGADTEPTSALSLPPTSPATPPAGFQPVTRNGAWEPVIEVIDGVEMALVPAGCFPMGSSEDDLEDTLSWCNEYVTEGECERDWFSSQTPQHEVCFDEPFWIDVYEVSNAVYGSAGEWAGDNLPRERISWYAAQSFCESRGARLPTEAEWEYAARGPDGLLYPWGNSFVPTALNFCDNNCTLDWTDESLDDGYSRTAPIGSFPEGVSWIGAYDMSGNVLEWVNDWYGEDYYESLTDGVVDPQGPGTGTYSVTRGGAWSNLMYNVRTVTRIQQLRDGTGSSMGFRCAHDY